MTASGVRIPLSPPFALVAQLDRASVYGTEGRRFESCRVRFIYFRMRLCIEIFMAKFDDYIWMGYCLELARRASIKGEVPVGAIVVQNGCVIGSGFNQRETNGDPTAHAEVVAIREAAAFLGNWRVLDTTLYVTLEPCAMCAGALVNARVTRLVYGCPDPKAGAVDSLFRLPTDGRLNHRLTVVSGVRSRECASVLTSFFRARRKRKK